MKRYLVLILTVALLLPCLIVPASAADSNVVDAIVEQTQSIKEYFNARWATIDAWWDTYIGLINDKLLNIRNYISYILNYFTDDSYGNYNDGTNTYSVTHFQSDMIDLWGHNWFWLYEELQTGSSQYTIGTAINTIRHATYEHYKAFTNYFTSASKSYSYSRYGWMNGKWQVVETTAVYVTPFVYDLRTSIDSVLSYFKFLVKGDDTTIGEDIAPIETEADSMIDSMETAPTISVDDIENEVDKITEFEPDTDYLDILSSIFLNEVFLTMFSWSIILAMLGYILYGKV